MSKQVKGSRILKDGFSLFAVTAIFILLLAGAYLITSPVIQAHHASALAASLPNVIPAAADGHFSDPVDVEGHPSIRTYTIGYANDRPVGVAFEINVAGWNPDLMFLVGVDLAGEITGIEILSHEETPGIGCAIEEDVFLDQFVGRTAGIVHVPGGQSTAGNQIALITGVTLSARVMVEGANEALEYFHTTFMPALAERYDVEAPDIPKPPETGEPPIENEGPQESLEGAFGRTVYVNEELGILSYTVGLIGGRPIGAFFRVAVEGAYSDIVFLVSIDRDGTVRDLTIVSHDEALSTSDLMETEAVLAGVNEALVYFNANLLSTMN